MLGKLGGELKRGYQRPKSEIPQGKEGAQGKRKNSKEGGGDGSEGKDRVQGGGNTAPRTGWGRMGDRKGMGSEN